MMTAPEWLSKRTFVIEHNPNCPMPFLVRLPGKNKGVIDKLPYGGLGDITLTKDILGFGKTLREAADAARKQEKENARHHDKPQ